MIVDSSALVAIVFAEAEREEFVQVIVDAPDVRMSAATYVETAIVVDSRRDPSLSRTLDEYCALLEVRVVDLTPGQARLAREAYRDFGKGSGHRAQLNLGDCFSYALATDLRDTLLFTGVDFTHTYVRPAT